VGNIKEIKWIITKKYEVLAIFKKWNQCFNTIHKIIDLEAGTLYIDSNYIELFEF